MVVDEIPRRRTLRSITHLVHGIRAEGIVAKAVRFRRAVCSRSDCNVDGEVNRCDTFLHMPEKTAHVDHERFATTRWSLVVSAARDSTPESRRALSALCEAYWYPLYAYVRRRVNDVHEAEELTQAFFVELLEKNYVAVADPGRGRFRAFLLTACKHFLSREWEKSKAQKRGGGRVPIPLDFESANSRLNHEPAPHRRTGLRTQVGRDAARPDPRAIAPRVRNGGQIGAV